MLPVYRDITVGGAAESFCSVNDAGVYNRHGNRHFLRLELGSRATVRFTMTQTSAPATTDPDFFIYRSGTAVAAGQSPDADSEVETATLDAGTYIIDAYDFVNAEQGATGHDSCFTFVAEAG